MVKCLLCNREFNSITNVHLSMIHKMKFNEYREMFPDADLGSWYTNQLKQVRKPENIKKRNIAASKVLSGRPAWNKGLTKATDNRVVQSGWSEEAKEKCKEDFRTGRRIGVNKGKKFWTPEFYTKMHEKYLTGWLPNPTIGRGRQGVREDLGHFVRSVWEANICRIFKYCGIDYEYESETCRINLGDSLYICDFYLPKLNIFVECKGYLYEDAKIKYRKVLEKFPNIDWRVIDSEVYHILAKKYEKLIPEWETYYFKKGK